MLLLETYCLIVEACNVQEINSVYLDQSIELLISADGQLEMSRCNTLHLLHNRQKLRLLENSARIEGVMSLDRLGTLRSFEAFPASSRTSAVRYSASTLMSADGLTELQHYSKLTTTFQTRIRK